MKKKFLLLMAMFLTIALLGCSGSKNEDNTPPPEPEVFEITATDVVVKETELPEVVNSKIVRADFNMDNLEDMALAEEDAGGKSAIYIYLQKQSDGLNKTFYKAGRIQETGDYTISALMTRKVKENDHIDLLVMFNYITGRKELVYYRSDGKSFREIQREIRGGGEADSSE